jgi:hypothetical protein
MSVRRAADSGDRLWRAADAQRNAGSLFDPVALVNDARGTGAPLGWRDVTQLIERISAGAGEWTPAPFLVDFIRTYLQGRSAPLLFDPAVTAPAAVVALADGDIAQAAIGVVSNLALADAISHATENTRVTWTTGWRLPPDLTRSGAPEPPELIVSFPPLGMRRVKARYATASGNSITVNDAAGLHLLLTATEMTDSGEALFLVPNGFLLRMGAAKVRAVLPQFGLHVHACVNVLNAFVATGVTANLISIRKEPAESVWVGQLSPRGDATRLAEGLRSREPGRTPEQGRLVVWETFEGFERLAANERLERLVKRAGFPTVALSDLVTTDIEPPKHERDSLIDPTPNTVYLPTFLNAHAHSDVDAEGLKSSGYVALPLDPTKAIAEHVASMLNSELGRAIRAALSGGVTIPSLRISALRDAVLPLPPLETQREALTTRQGIRDLRVSLDELDKQLTERPRDAVKLRRELRQLGQTDPLKAWMETLPFPLASIVWRYRADAEPAAKVDHLLRLFEATAEFFVTVLLSAFASNDALLTAERASWCDETGRIPLERASFGNWTKLGAAMAGSVRRLASSTEEEGAKRSQMASAFAVTSSSFIELVSGKNLWKLLDGLTEERNVDAHGGIKGPAERQHKLARLEVALTHLRALTSEGAQDVRLVLPGEGAYRKGVNQYRKAQHLSGYVEAFPQAMLESTEQLESDELYLVDVSDEPVTAALKIAPLVQLRSAPSTEENACYFYSRLDGDQAEYVSHHFEKEARIPVEDAELLALLGRLNPPQ